MGKISIDELKKLERLPFWPFLRTKSGSALLGTIRSDWEELLNKKDTNEATYQTFLAAHAGFFFGRPASRAVVISKLRLGRDHEVDFVIATDQRSSGLMYTFVEIETPHKQPYTKGGDPSARLTHALQQIRDWRRWLAANRSEAKRLFPSVEFLLNDHPMFRYKIVIGRRDMEDRSLHKRNALSEEADVEIRSFDSLTDKFDRKAYLPLATDFTNTSSTPSIAVLHELANPFWVAFSDAEWSELRTNPRFERLTHMIESNAALLVNHRRLSTRYEEFLNAVAMAPPDDVKPFYHLFHDGKFA